MAELSKIETKVLAGLLREPRSCSTIGSELWGIDSSRPPQAYARPAGRILSRLKKEGLVEQVLERRRFVYRLTAKGRRQTQQERLD